MEDTITVTGPTRSEQVYLRPAAWNALAVWTERSREAHAAALDQPYKPGPVMRQIAELEEDPITSQLIAMARILPIDPNPLGAYQDYKAARALVELHNKLAPIERPAATAEPDACRHGVPYSQDCTQCDA